MVVMTTNLNADVAVPTDTTTNSEEGQPQRKAQFALALDPNFFARVIAQHVGTEIQPRQKTQTGVNKRV